jgi:penicillin amidase
MPILASDMHLQLRAPSIWYVVALHARTSGYQAAGLTLPGVPGVVAGYNRDVAWTYTNGMVDDMDFVSEAVDLDHSAYRHEDAWRPFAIRHETIQVRGRDQPVVHEVRATVRGPVITDALAPVGATLSLLWTAATPLSEIDGLMAMNRAVDAESLDAAIRSFSVHQQNVMYATRGGAIGFRLSGTVPLRRADRRVTPADFTDDGAEWPGFWSAAALPATRDPEAGFVVSANNLQTRELEGVLSVDYPTPFRARRITDRLASRTDWDRGSVSMLQRDVYSLMAERTVPMAIAAARRADMDSALAILETWNLEVRTDSRAAALFYAWLFRLRGLIAADEFGPTPGWAVFPTGTLLRLVETAGDSPWVDDATTPGAETFDELSEQALRDAVALTGYRPWGDLHREIHRHPLGYARWLDRVFAFNVGSYPSPGGPNTVRPDDYGRWNRFDSLSWTPPWPNEYGPSERFIIELRPGGNVGFFLLPTGQSGNPLSPHYRDQAKRWGSGRLIPVPLDASLVRQRTVRRFVLEPIRARN